MGSGITPAKGSPLRSDIKVEPGATSIIEVCLQLKIINSRQEFSKRRVDVRDSSGLRCGASVGMPRP